MGLPGKKQLKTRESYITRNFIIFNLIKKREVVQFKGEVVYGIYKLAVRVYTNDIYCTG